MPRGQNQNSKKALAKNRKKTQFSGERAVKASKKSAEKRREYASFRECFSENMDDDKRKELFDMLYRRAKNGNLKAFEILRDTMGEKPTEYVEAEIYDNSGLLEVLSASVDDDGMMDDSDMIGDEDG